MQINIIECPSNLGLKKKETDTEPGVKWLPDWLNERGFHDQIEPKKIYRIKAPSYSTNIDPESGVRNADQIVEYAVKQSEQLSQLLKEDDTFQLLLGGDCSILIGSAISLKLHGNYGLFFLDGHTDYIGTDLSQTGGAAGMDLAIVTGHGHSKLTDIQSLSPYVDEHNVFCVGNREYDAKYVRPILESSISYYDLESLRKTGGSQVVKTFLTMIDKNNLDGFFIHLDIDVLNDDVMPAVDSRAKDGLSYSELSEILTLLMTSKKAVGIEITILDPSLDPKGEYTDKFIQNFLQVMNDVRAFRAAK